jgi:hypothetical protein
MHIEKTKDGWAIIAKGWQSHHLTLEAAVCNMRCRQLERRAVEGSLNPAFQSKLELGISHFETDDRPIWRSRIYEEKE